MQPAVAQREPGEAVVAIVRHGSTRWSRLGRFTGHHDVPLDGPGRRQADVAAQRIAELEPRLVVTSDLRRATGTADRIRRRVAAPVRHDPRLREERLGRWEGLTRTEVAALYPEEFARWDAGELLAGPDREGLDAVTRRASAALNDALDQARSCVVVTHANVAIGLTQLLLGMPQDGRVHVPTLAPGSYRTLRRDRHGTWTLEDPPW